MLDFGEELTIDTFKIPWLMWIQIFVLLLLLILLYCFSIFSLDPPHLTSSSSSASSSSGPSNLSHPTNKRLLIKRSSQPSQVGGRQSLKGEISTSTMRRTVLASGGEVIHERESASSTNAINYHPCHYFKLARLAFLKCLGLDSSENPSSHEQRKER